jgi:transposase
MRRPRTTGPRVILRVLVVARAQMGAEPTRAINSVTAFLRTIDLGVDARKALLHNQFKAIAGWRDRRDDSVVSHLPTRSHPIGQAHRRPRWRAGRQPQGPRSLTGAPELCELPGAGSVVAASVFTAWSHPGRVRSEAAFAALAGTCPISASSGNTLRHRLNRGGMGGQEANRRLDARWAGFGERKKRAVVANAAIARELASRCWSLAILDE